MSKFQRWLPALCLMSIIFLVSSTPSNEIPNLGSWDLVIKKSGHIIGYGFLALSFWFALGWKQRIVWFPFILAIGYAITDEFHQSLVPGRNANLLDVIIFDGLGASLALGLAWMRINYLKDNHSNSISTSS